MKKILCAAAVCLLTLHTHANDFTAKEQQSIEQLIQAFKQKDVETISKRVHYPLQRDKPLPAIENATQMKQRFEQVFDASLQQKIAASDLSNWSSVGWRGIMLDNGDVWINEVDDNPNSPLKITAVNHSSSKEQQWRQQLLQQQKNALHPSLRQFSEPEVVVQTPTHLVRIDHLGEGRYRYASWKKNHSTKEQPDLIISNGKLEYYGSGGNHEFVFTNGKHAYHVYIEQMGSGEGDEASLTVYQNQKVILKQNATIVD